MVGWIDSVCAHLYIMTRLDGDSYVEKMAKYCSIHII